jgi:ABC-type hemin transport system substrate-binding protein
VRPAITLPRRSFVALPALATLSACTRSALSPHRAAQRIVSVAPNTTEMLFALGLGSRVVGVSSVCDFPREATSLPKVGALATLSLEAILALRPDAVVGAPGVPNAIVERLRARSITVLIEPVESIASVRSLARSLCALCEAPAALARWLDRFDRELAESAQLFTPRSPPRVLAVIDQRPLVCAGPRSYVDELLVRAHAVNALQSGPAWPQLSLEAVVQLAPDVIIDLCGPLAQTPLSLAWSAHRAIPAVRDRRVLAVDDPLVTRPGPRAPRAIALVATALRASGVGR